MKTPLPDELEAQESPLNLVRESEPEDGASFARCIVAVGGFGKTVILAVLNDPASHLKEFIEEVWGEYDWTQPIGIYQVDFGMKCWKCSSGWEPEEYDCALTDSNWVEIFGVEELTSYWNPKQETPK